MHRGYIKIWRKLEDSGLLQMHSTLALFMHMLMKATYKPCRIGMVELERGQLITGRIKLAEAIGVSDRQVRTCLDRLHDLNILTSKATNHFTVYTIVNYNEYQDIDSSIDQPIDQPPTNKRPTTDQPPTTIQEANTLSIKEVKKETKEASAFALPDWINSDHWNLWIKTRKGKKLISEQMQSNVEKLEKWKIAGLDYGKALKDAADAGWQGLHEPKNGYQKSPKADNFETKDYGTGVNPL